MFDFGKAETIGKRANQEDYSAFIAECRQPADGPERSPDGASSLVAALADGMGGHIAGQIASRTAVAGFKTHYNRSAALSPDERLHESLIAANESLAESFQEDPALHGMGCTFIGALFEDSALHWVSVGDSVLYLYRNGDLTRLNADHSMAPQLDQMAARNEITREQAQKDPMRHALRSALMGSALELIDQSSGPYPLHPGDWIIIASDGIDTLNKTAIESTIEQAGDRGAQAVAGQLIANIEAAGDPGQDNASVMVVRRLPSAI